MEPYKEAQQRIATEEKEQSGTLDLSKLGLTSLPPTIARLTSLQVLDLSFNELSKLPSEITALTELKTLLLYKNRLSMFPPEIVSLTALQTLSLDGNYLTKLPPEIGGLTALQALNIMQNEINTLPHEICFLLSLQRLDLNDNDVVTLPDAIASLTSLEALYLSRNSLRSLPDIRSLIHLESLALGGNELGRFPESVFLLVELKRLFLWGNNLNELPSEIGSLTQLAELSLHHNHLTGLPPEIDSLTALELLDLRENQLTSLPSELRRLRNLRYLYLHGNPDLNLSPTVLGPNPAKRGLRSDPFPSSNSILDFYFGRLVSKTRPLNEVKLILVGRGGAGKTSLVRALRALPFREGETSTPGIALSDLPVEGCKGGDVTAHVWDFAGQVITHALHQFFFSVRSVYVLVLTGRENSEREDAEYWLRLIKAFGSEEGDAGPSVIIALNKWDMKGCRPKVDRGALKERYPFIHAFVEVDCKTKKGIEKLKETLKREVSRLRWVREPFKAAWDEVHRDLTKGRKAAAYLTYDKFREICEQRGISDRQEQDSLAEVLHNLGSALNYRNDPRLREATVLQPQWLTKNVYSLVRKAEKQAGVLKRPEVETALPRVTDPKMRDYLIRLMERFEIAYSSRTSSAATWLVPQALPDVQPKGAEEFASISDATRLRYTYQALPEGLVARAIVRLHEFIEEVKGKKQQWASGAILIREGARALLRTEPQDRQVMLTVIGPADARRQLAGLCQAEMRDIHREIQGLDPIEETRVGGAWIATATLEADEKNRKQTGLATKDRGTVSIDPTGPNDAFSMKEARVEEIWKPKAFICYSKTNIHQRKRLESELKILRNEGLLATHWHDRMIDPGDKWDQTIQRELVGADIILILLSAACLSTDYIVQTEIPHAMDLHEAGEAIVVPIVLQACRWDQTGLGDLQAVPEKGKPIDKWRPQSEAWKSVADELASVCQKLMTAKPDGRHKDRMSLRI